MKNGLRRWELLDNVFKIVAVDHADIHLGYKKQDKMCLKIADKFKRALKKHPKGSVEYEKNLKWLGIIEET